MAIDVSEEDGIRFINSNGDFKKAIADKFIQRDKSAEEMAKEIGVTTKTLYNW